MTIDMETRRKFRAILKAVIDHYGARDVLKLAELVLTLKGKNKYVDELIEYAHVDRYDSVMWEEFVELVFEALNPYVSYDRELYGEIKRILGSR